MKKSLLLLILVTVGIITKATDLIVEENGVLPSYNSITAAIAAASSGDRIFIKNKSGNLPWLENITISKSLDLLSFVNDSFFIVQGSVSISPAANSTINIIGMIDLVGSISTTTVPTGNRSIVRILGGQFGASGTSNLVFLNNNYDVTVQGCYLYNGFIEYEHGSIVGNTIVNATSYGIYAAAETSTTSDTSYIFGNKISNSYTNGYGIYWASTTMFFDIRNNFVSSPFYGIYVSNTESNTTPVNKMYNNTVSILNSGTSPLYGINITGASGSQIDVQNNVVDRNSAPNYTYYGIYAVNGSGGNMTVAYNYVDVSIGNPVSGTITVNQNNNTASTITLNANGSTQSSVGLNGGNPGVQFYDTDLTINDAGCYGGSYTLNNFFPQFTGSTNTWLTNYQFNIRTGSTLSIKANSYDK